MKYPDSPCIAVCDVLYNDICSGCGRHFSEVSNWVFYTDEEKTAVWERIEADQTAWRYNRYKERVEK